MTELEQKVLEAKDYFHKVNHEAFEAVREYNHLQTKTNELREEWLGLCGILKSGNTKQYDHFTGLIMLEQRMRNAYRNVRLASLRMLRKSVELLAETNRAYRGYMSLMKSLGEEEEKSCGE